jgi:hypothetical protein
MQGLLDIVTLGNCLELAKTFDIWDYASDDGDEGIPEVETAQRAALFDMYSAFQEHFCERYVLDIDKKLSDPWEVLFRPTLINLAVSIYKYKNLQDGVSPSMPSKGVRERLETHFRFNRPTMLVELLALLECPIEQLAFCRTFDWMGPDFSIVPKPANFAVEPCESAAPGAVPSGSPPPSTELAPPPPPASPARASLPTSSLTAGKTPIQPALKDSKGKRKRDGPAGKYSPLCNLPTPRCKTDPSSAAKGVRHAKRE